MYGVHLIALFGIIIGYVHVEGRATPNCISSGEMHKYRSDALNIHNKLRKLHGVPSLTASDSLDDAAQIWADELADGAENGHTEGDGENIYFGSSSSYRTANATADVLTMYSEEKPHYIHIPGHQNDISQVGHFTQIIWKDSCELGVGIEFSAGCHSYSSVFRYSPIGNLNTYSTRMMEDNVRPVGSEPVRNCCDEDEIEVESSYRLEINNQEQPDLSDVNIQQIECVELRSSCNVGDTKTTCIFKCHLRNGTIVVSSEPFY